MASCIHASSIRPVAPPAEGCETCLETGDTWVHLRECLTCGRTLCCDDSPNRHMSRHAREAGHPIMRSAEPGEDWVWCFPDDAPLRERADGWHTFDPDAIHGARVAREVVAGGGSLDVPVDHVTADGYPLGEWLRYVRSQRETGALDPDDAAEIESVPGWRWQVGGAE